MLQILITAFAGGYLLGDGFRITRQADTVKEMLVGGAQMLLGAALIFLT